MIALKLFQKGLSLVLIFFFITIVIRREEVSTVLCCSIAFFIFFPYIYKHINDVPKSVINIACVMIITFFLSCIYNSTNIIYPIKFTSYVLLFIFGYLAGKYNIRVYVNDKKILFLTIIIVGYFIVAHTGTGGGFFELKNTYVYFGLVMALIYYCSHLNNPKVIRNTLVILFLFVLSATNLGIVAAICISYAIYSLDSPKKIAGTFALFTIGVLFITSIDIPLFVRIKSVYTLASNIPVSELSNLQNTTTFELIKEYGSGVEDEGDSSFLFRLVHWTKILMAYTNADFFNILLGHGDLTVKENFGLQSHNEYIKIIYENGIVILICFICFIRFVLNAIKPLKLRYVVFSPFVYFFSENLLLFSFCNFFIFLIVGYLVGISKSLKYESC